MAKGKNRFRGYEGGYVPMHWKLLNHPAYIKLPPTARGMLPYFLGKVKIGPLDAKYTYQEFQFSYTEATRYGCARRSFYRVIEDLVGHGFIDPVHRGVRNPSIFRLSRRWEAFGTAAFEKVAWAQFGETQVRGLVQKWHSTVAKNEPETDKQRVQVCQK